MKLTDINLADPTEIAAAIALLQAINGEAIRIGQGDETVSHRVGDTVVTSIGAHDPARLAAVGQVMVQQAPPAMITPQAAQVGLPQLAPLAVELDSSGLPWDERIHAGTKSKNKDGAWTGRRGLSDAEKAAVPAIEAELRARVAQSAAPAAPAPVAPAAIPQPQVVPSLPGVTAAGVPPVGALPPLTGGASAPAVALPDPVSFEDLMQRVAPAVPAGILPPDAFNTAMRQFNIQNARHLSENPAYVPHVWAALKASYPALA